jgi:hypothetical protein
MADYMADTAGSGQIVPTDVIAVAGYVDGYKSYPNLLKTYYPDKHILSICVTSTDTAEVLDIEKGDAVPADAGPWVRRMLDKGIYKPCLYAQESNMDAVRASLGAAKLDRSEYRLWVAAWPEAYANGIDRPGAVIGGFDAWQFYGTFTGPWDYSIVSSSFFRKKVKKAPAHKTAIKKVKPTRKVTAATVVSAIVAAVTVVLKHNGVDLTTAEAAELTALSAGVAGWLRSEGK